MNNFPKEMMDEQMMRWLSQEALRQAMETISAQLVAFSNDPILEGLDGREAVLAAAKAILSTNNQCWGEKQ